MKECSQDNETVSLFKALADESRLKIISMLLRQDCYAQYLANKLNLSAPTITYHMDKLEKAKVVYSTKIQHYIIYSINREIMDTQIGMLIKSAIAYDEKMTYEDKVIENFFEYGRLKTIPAQLKKREIVIAHIASRFELARTYSEKDLVSVIIEIHDDYCTIKRDLIGMGFLKDMGKSYKRIK